MHLIPSNIFLHLYLFVCLSMISGHECLQQESALDSGTASFSKPWCFGVARWINQSCMRDACKWRIDMYRQYRWQMMRICFFDMTFDISLDEYTGISLGSDWFRRFNIDPSVRWSELNLAIPCDKPFLKRCSRQCDQLWHRHQRVRKRSAVAKCRRTASGTAADETAKQCDAWNLL